MGAMTGDDLAERKAKATELIELLGWATRWVFSPGMWGKQSS